MRKAGEAADSARVALERLSSINELSRRERKTPENIQARREHIAEIMYGLAGRHIVFDPHKDQPEQRTYQVPDTTNKSKEAQQLQRRLELTIAKVAVAKDTEVVSEAIGMFEVWGELKTRILKSDSPDEDYARRVIREDEAIQIEGRLVRYDDGTVELNGDLLSGASEVVSARVLVSNAEHVHSLRDPDTMRQDPVVV